MTRSVAMMVACVAMCLLLTGCDDGTSGWTMVPRAPVALIISSDQGAAQAMQGHNLSIQDYDLVMLWTDGEIATDLFNVYRRTGDDSYEKLNSRIVRRGPFLGIPSAPVGTGFVDSRFDIGSTSRYSYYVVAANSHGEESAPSDSVTLVPADLDPAALVTGLAPNEALGVGLNPTFNWDPVSVASSYCLVLMEDTQEYGTVPVWIYRTGGTSASLASTEGVTYLHGVGKSLEQNTGYVWGVFAIGASNSAIASGFAEFSTANPVGTIVE